MNINWKKIVDKFDVFLSGKISKKNVFVRFLIQNKKFKIKKKREREIVI